MPATVIKRKKILFIHIPKCAGTSIELILRSISKDFGNNRLNGFEQIKFIAANCSLQHIHRDLINVLINTKKLDYIFLVTRNPYFRIISEFKWQIHKPWAHNGFDSWYEHVRKSYDLDKFSYDNHLRPQHEFLIDKARVYRFEDGIEKPVKELLQYLKINKN